MPLLHLIALTLAATALTAAETARTAVLPAVTTTPTYPRSTHIRGMRWLSEPAIYPGSNGDTWSCTWAADGSVFTTADDCQGINHSNASNLALFRIAGSPPEGHVISLANPMAEYGRDTQYDGYDTWKAAGLISIDGVLYMGIGKHSRADAYGDLVQRTYDGSVIKSTDQGRTWSPKPKSPMFPTPRFATPFFVQFGKDYEGAQDGYVYLSSGTSWNNGNHLSMMRVARDRIGNLNPDDYELLTGISKGEAVWAPYRPQSFVREGHIFVHRGFTGMTGIHWVPAAKRFVMPQWSYRDLDGSDPWKRTFLAMYEAPNPWGPWSLFHVEEDFGNAWYNPSLPAAWFEDGGRRMWMVCGGDFAGRRAQGRPDYAFCIRKLELLLE